MSEYAAAAPERAFSGMRVSSVRPSFFRTRILFGRRPARYHLLECGMNAAAPHPATEQKRRSIFRET